jgi:hypothetical protein
MKSWSAVVVAVVFCASCTGIDDDMPSVGQSAQHLTTHTKPRFVNVPEFYNDKRQERYPTSAEWMLHIAADHQEDRIFFYDGVCGDNTKKLAECTTGKFYDCAAFLPAKNTKTVYHRVYAAVVDIFGTRVSKCTYADLMVGNFALDAWDFQEWNGDWPGHGPMETWTSSGGGHWFLNPPDVDQTGEVTHGPLAIHCTQTDGGTIINGELDPLCVAPRHGKRMRIEARLLFEEQMRDSPNGWETPWLFMAYSDRRHYYYVAPKTKNDFNAAWEIGKYNCSGACSLYPGETEGQETLETGTGDLIVKGDELYYTAEYEVLENTADSKVKISFSVCRNPVDNVCQGTASGSYVDDGTRGKQTDPLRGGGVIGFYTEDAKARFFYVAVSSMEIGN